MVTGSSLTQVLACEASGLKIRYCHTLLPRKFTIEVAFVGVSSQGAPVLQFHPTRTAVYVEDNADGVLKTWLETNAMLVEEIL